MAAAEISVVETAAAATAAINSAAANPMKFCIILAGIILLVLGAWRYSSLSRHYASTLATISGLQPQNHASFDYVYTVSGATHSGTAPAQAIGRDLNSLRIGDQVTVFYDTQHPDDSTVEPPNLRGIMSIWMLIFGGILFSTFVVLWSRAHRNNFVPAR